MQLVLLPLVFLSLLSVCFSRSGISGGLPPPPSIYTGVRELSSSQLHGKPFICSHLPSMQFKTGSKDFTAEGKEKDAYLLVLTQTVLKTGFQASCSGCAKTQQNDSGSHTFRFGSMFFSTALNCFDSVFYFFYFSSLEQLAPLTVMKVSLWEGQEAGCSTSLLFQSTFVSDDMTFSLLSSPKLSLSISLVYFQNYVIFILLY